MPEGSEETRSTLPVSGNRWATESLPLDAILTRSPRFRGAATIVVNEQRRALPEIHSVLALCSYLRPLALVLALSTLMGH